MSVRVGILLTVLCWAAFLPTAAQSDGNSDCAVNRDGGEFTFVGHVHSGDAYRCKFSPAFSFELEPTSSGWEIAIKEEKRDENLARLTPSENGQNPLLIDLLSLQKDTPNLAADHAGKRREFIFSPEVGRSMAANGTAPTPQEIAEVAEQGKGLLKITDMRFSDGTGMPAAIQELTFDVSLRLGGLALLHAFAYRPGTNEFSHAIKSPQAVFSPDPDYPIELRRKRIAGTVVLWLIVDQNGLPRGVKVARSAHPELDSRAIAAVKRWRFKPATMDGKPVAVQINVEVEFRVDRR